MTVDEALDGFAELRESQLGHKPRMKDNTSRSPLVSETKHAVSEAQSTIQSIIARYFSTHYHSASIEEAGLARLEPFESQKDRTRT